MGSGDRSTTGRRALLTIAFIAAGLAMISGVALAGGAGDVVVETTANQSEIAPNETVTVDVVATIENGSDVGAHETAVFVPETDVARIVAVEAAGEPELGENETISSGGESATIEAAYGDSTLETDANGHVVIATVTLEAKAEGRTPVEPDVSAIGDGDGNSYTVRDQNGTTVSVTRPTAEQYWESELGGQIEENDLFTGDDAVFSITKTEETDGEYISVLHALEASDGSERWSISHDERLQIVGVDEQVIAAQQGSDGNQDQLVALEPETGTQAWAFNVTGNLEAHTTTLNAESDEVYVASNETFAILNASSGDVKRTVSEFGPNEVVEADGTVYAVGENRTQNESTGELRAVTEANGTVWQTQTPDGDKYWSIEYGPNETLLIQNGSSVTIYEAADGSVQADQQWDKYVSDAVSVGDGYLVSLGTGGDEYSEIVHVSPDGSTKTTATHETGPYSFYDGTTGLYLTEGPLTKINETTYEIEWTADETVDKYSITETPNTIAGVTTGDDGQQATAFDPETGLAKTFHETDNWIPWTAYDDTHDQLYLALPRSVAAFESVDIDAVTLSGTVTDANGNALSGDHLGFFTKYHSFVEHTTIDDNGTYSVAAEANTTLYVGYQHATENGSLDASADRRVDLHMFEPVEVGTQDEVIDFEVPNGHRLNVTVTDESGDPIRNASVQVYDRQWIGENSSVGTGTGERQTTAAGQLEFPSADEPGIDLVGDARVIVRPPEGDDRFDDREYERTVTVDEPTNVTIALGEPDAELPPVTGETPPRDLSDDGLYEDVTGDGRFTVADVQALFDNRNSDAIAENPNAFDFSDNGDIGPSDVQALWERLQG